MAYAANALNAVDTANAVWFIGFNGGTEMRPKVHTVNVKFKALQKEAEGLVNELSYPDRLTEEREAFIYSRLTEIEKTIYG